MMSLQYRVLPSSLPRSQFQNQRLPFSPPPRKPHQLKACAFKVACRGLGFEDIAAVTQNKVLIAATMSAAIGQLSKPFASSIIYKKGFDFMVAFQSGGFPSSHSSVVVAAATALGLERGFSDPIFGMSVVYAALVMYDSQGVRREVGNHAKVLNKILLGTQINSVLSNGRDSVIDSKPKSSPFSDSNNISPPLYKNSSSSVLETKRGSSVLVKSDDETSRTNKKWRSSELATNAEEGSERVPRNLSLLKESVGHTEIEVIAGALLGFLVTLAVYSIM